MKFRPLAITLLTFAALAVPAAPPITAQEPAVIAVVDFREALLATAEIQKEGQELEAKYRPRQEELNQINQELEQLQGRAATATGSEAISIQNEFRRKQREAQRMQEDLQSDVEFERASILQDAQQKMIDIVGQLANQKGLDLVVDISNTVFFKPALDITQESTAAYDRAYPLSSQ